MKTVRAISTMPIVLRWRMVIVSSTASSCRPVSSSTVCSMLCDDLLALVLAAVDEQPPRALGHVPPHDQDADGEDRAEAEGEPPAPGRVDDRRVEQRDREQRAGRRPDPERAVDRDVDATAVLRRDQLVDGRVDGGVLAADAHAGQEPRAEVPQRRHRERRQHGRDDVDAERDQEELLAPEPVGQLAEEQRSDAGARDVDRARQADVEAGSSPSPVSVGLSASDIEPTIVTSSPSRIQTVPRPITTIQCHRAQGSRSSRAGMSVVMRPVSTPMTDPVPVRGSRHA